MSHERWSAVDRYVADLLVPSDPALDAALAANAAAGLPAHDVSPAQGRLLEILARMRGARRILEIGTLGGYSTIWLARGLAPGGRLVTLERDGAYADVARGNLARAGLDGVVEVRVGPALEALPAFAAEDEAPFDLVFVDADKESAAEYAHWALRLTVPGSAIVFDNVVRAGALADAGSDDARVRGVRALHERSPARRASLRRRSRRSARRATTGSRSRSSVNDERGGAQDSVTIVLTVEVTPSSSSTTTM